MTKDYKIIKKDNLELSKETYSFEEALGKMRFFDDAIFIVEAGKADKIIKQLKAKD